MKRLIILLILCVMVCVGGGCTQKTEEPPESTTLMIYMVGSDLEAKSGAGTADLEEIAESGIDLEKNNVIVYAGGAAKWHNEVARAEDHTILELTEQGFGAVAAKETSSMGDAACLTELLHYGYQYYPADQYVLILWNHGNGPVIGYGKDMLFDQDSLTLQEMQTALADSPFGEKEKLTWVGFDACLMASAELCGVWAEYADYLVASQEVEPSFGWDYSFLAKMGQVDTKTLLQDLTENYLAACEAYYEERGYENRDTTLSCMDLSKTQALEKAVNALFEKIEANVDESYHEQTVKRAQTRALGRASTGSEYDLIDLANLAQQLEELYPEEATKLSEVLKQMVIANASNAEDCCGLSLYYPFYNREYYEEGWGETYAELGMFASYQQYLQSYQKIWLQSDLVDEVANSSLPVQETEEQYTLQLTPEQSQSLAQVRYYILKREGENLYTKVYSSQEVTNEEGLLTAHFDGNVLYAQNEYGLSVLPVLQEFDTVGSEARYSVYARLSNAISGMIAWPEGYEYQVEGYRFDLVVDRERKDISVSALVPYDLELDADTLMSGKAPDADLSGWTTYIFLSERHQYVTRYDDGTVRPLDDWACSEVYSGYEMPIADGLEFVYGPLIGGEYGLIFEMTDTQGNRYCSEILPIEVAEFTRAGAENHDTIALQWESGERVTILQENGVTVWLKRGERWGEPMYAFEVENQNEFPVVLKNTRLLCNESVDCSDGYLGYFAIGAGETLTDPSGLNLGTVEDLGVLSEIRQLEMSFKVENALSRATLVKQQTIKVEMSEKTAVDMSVFAEETISGTYLGAKAAAQTLYEDESCKVDLVSCGEDALFGQLTGYLCVTNKSEHEILLEIEGVVLNDVYIPISSQVMQISAHNQVYKQFSVLNDKVERGMIMSIGTMQLQLRRMDYKALAGGFSETIWCPIRLSEADVSGGGHKEWPEGKLLTEENGIRLSLLNEYEENGAHYWNIMVENESVRDIQLALSNVAVNGEIIPDGEYGGQYLDDGQVGAHQKCMSVISYRGEQAMQELSFTVRVLDFNGEDVWFETSETLVLQAE